MALSDYLFYQEPGITLYCGDCREIIPELSGGAILTDPPYGIGYVHGAERGPNASLHNNTPVVGDETDFDPSFILKLDVPSILWGANHYAHCLPKSRGWLVWDKRCNTVVNDQSDCELAWTNVLNTARIFYHVWDGFRRQTEKNFPRVHPTQKPVALMTWCLGFIDPSLVVIDPFSGSGPILESAKLLNRKAIGIEIEPRYCEIAVKRLRQEVLPLDMTP